MTNEEIEEYVTNITACPSECMAYNYCESEYSADREVPCAVMVKKFLLLKALENGGINEGY